MPSSDLLSLVLPSSLPELWKNGHKNFAFKVFSRSLQAVLALAIIIIYAVSLSKFGSHNLQAPADWIYAEVVAFLSLIACALHYFYDLESAWWSITDFMLCILWTAQAGTFGTIYLSGGGSEDIEDGFMSAADRGSMKAGAVIGLVCLILWFATFVQSLVWRCKARRNKRANRKRVDRTIGTLEAYHRAAGPDMARYQALAPPPVSMNVAEPLPTYQDVTTEQALAKQREKIGVYDEEAAVGSSQGRRSGAVLDEV